MKFALTAIWLVILMTSNAQAPYNPDSDSDNLIGTVDLLDFLPLYGSDFYPQVAIQEQWCSVSSYDSCYVEDDTDVVYVNMNGPHNGTIGRGPVFLPDGNTFKKVIVLGNEGPFGADIWARDEGEENYYKIRNSFQSTDAEIFFRTATGKWRKIVLD